MEIKKDRFELGIHWLEGLSTSPLIINLGKIILPKNTKLQITEYKFEWILKDSQWC